jgi:hypothetical protein
MPCGMPAWCVQHGSDGSIVEKLADQRGPPRKPNERYVLLAGKG